MSLKYIFGGSGSGKTEICMSQIMAETEKMKKSALLYIVPEQFTMQAERELVLCSKEKSIMQAQVLSFKRLSHYIFSETGGIVGALLDETGKSMLLRKITLQLSKELQYFTKMVDKQGFIENLANTITEFYRYNISREDILKYLNEVRNKESLYLKMHDIHKIFSDFEQYISEKYISTEQVLDFVPERVEKSFLLENSEIWIDGFNGFTTQEYNIISSLLKRGRDVTVAMTVRSEEIVYDNLSEIDPFFETKNTINKLSKLANESNVKIEKPIFLQEYPRFNNFSSLSFLEKHYFSYKKESSNEQIDNIKIKQANNIYTEITYVANEIINLVREKNYRFSEIAVITGDISRYERGIKRMFRIYDIPFFIDTKLKILSHPLTELIRSSLDIIAYNFTYESVFRFLKTSLIDIEETDLFKLENYVLAYGIKQYKWKKEWTYGFTDGLYNKDKINETRVHVLDCLKPLAENFNNSKKYTVKEVATRVFEMLYNLNVTETLDLWGTDRVHVQVWNKICELMDKMVEILGDELVTIREFGKILDSGLQQSDIGIIPPSLDQVVIGDFERTR